MVMMMMMLMLILMLLLLLLLHACKNIFVAVRRLPHLRPHFRCPAQQEERTDCGQRERNRAHQGWTQRRS